MWSVPAGLYSFRWAALAAYLDTRVNQALLKWKFVNKMRTAGLPAIRDTPPPPAQPFISPVQHTFS
jgi:hypothetical protein